MRNLTQSSRRRKLLLWSWAAAGVLTLVGCTVALLLGASPPIPAATVVPAAVAQRAMATLAADPRVLTLGSDPGAPTAYVFEDPNCVFCARFDRAAAPLVAHGRLRLHVVLVAFLKASSAGRAAAIWGASSPASALMRNSDGFDALTENGGMAPVAPSAADWGALHAHMGILKALAGGVMTPTLLYREGDSWVIATGATPMLLQRIASRARPAQPPLPTQALRLGGHELVAEVARTDAERETGLMGRTTLAANHGMLFVFSKSQPVCMWMKDTQLPLSVAFLDADGRVLNTADMLPETLNAHCAASPARYALEMPWHWFISHSISRGAYVEK